MDLSKLTTAFFVEPSSGTWQPPDVSILQREFPAFTLHELKGRGGMGAVYKAQQVSLDRLVAIKVLPAEMVAEAGLAQRFRQEAMALARLQHPNIVSIFDCGSTSDGMLYFVMEFVDGSDLTKQVGPQGMETSSALEVIRQVCEALEYAHKEGVIHRDIKPGNILIDRNGRVKVADFGIAKMAEKQGETVFMTMPGIAMGTLDYSAPEQLSGASVDERTDVFSLGALAYYLLTGSPPRGTFLPPSQKCQCDPRLDALILRALRPDREARFRSAAEFKTELSRILGHTTTTVVDGASFEDAWHDLLLFIEEGLIVPIVGPDVLMIEIDGMRQPLYRHLARKLAEGLGLDPESLSPEAGLNLVAGDYLRTGRPAHRIYTVLHQLLSDPDLPVPHSLDILSRLSPLRLVVSITPDRLLEKALRRARPGTPLECLSFSRLDKNPADLPPLALERPGNFLYQLFGQSRSTEGSYAVTDEDVIEFFHALRSELRPANLMHTLHSRHLLLLGTGFPDWLARLFLREVKGRPFSASSPYAEILAERAVAGDAAMLYFFERYSRKTLIFPTGNPDAFLLELEKRWLRRHPTAVPVPAGDSDLMPEPEPDAIYISCCEEDAPTAAALKEALESCGLPVTDGSRLLAGDIRRDVKMQRVLRQCSLFVPVISPATQGLMQGFFRQEWKWACERAGTMDDWLNFIVPVSIGDVDQDDALVPSRFHRVPWLRLPAGAALPPESGTHFLKRFREYRKRQATP